MIPALLALLVACTPDDDSKLNERGEPTELTWVGQLAPFCDLVELGRVAIPGEYKTDVAVLGDHAYVTWGGGDYVQGLEVVDLSDPSAPTVVGHAETGDYWPLRVEAAGDLVFVAHQWDGVYIYDVGNPTLPILQSNPRVDLDPYTGYGVRVTDVAVDGRYLYVVGTHLVVYDIQDPSDPIEVGEVPAPWDDLPGSFPTLTETIAIDGDIAWVTDLEGRLFSVDIGDPTAPYILGDARWPGQAKKVAIAGTTAYLADLTFGIRTADVSDPADPIPLDTIGTSGESYTLALDGNHLFVGDNLNGLVSYDVSDPSAVSWVGYAHIDEGGGGRPGELAGGGPWGLWASGGTIVAVTKPDLRIYADCSL